MLTSVGELIEIGDNSLAAASICYALSSPLEVKLARGQKQLKLMHRLQILSANFNTAFCLEMPHKFVGVSVSLSKQFVRTRFSDSDGA